MHRWQSDSAVVLGPNCAQDVVSRLSRLKRPMHNDSGQDNSTEHLKLEAAFLSIRPPMPKKSSAHSDAATVISEVVAKLDGPRARLD